MIQQVYRILNFKFYIVLQTLCCYRARKSLMTIKYYQLTINQELSESKYG